MSPVVFVSDLTMEALRGERRDKETWNNVIRRLAGLKNEPTPGRRPPASPLLWLATLAVGESFTLDWVEDVNGFVDRDAATRENARITERARQLGIKIRWVVGTRRTVTRVS